MIANSNEKPKDLSPYEVKKSVMNLIKNATEMFKSDKNEGNKLDGAMSVMLSHELCRSIKADLAILKNVNIRDYILNKRLIEAAKDAVEIFTTHYLFEIEGKKLTEEKTKEIKKQLLEAIDGSVLLPVIFHTREISAKTSERMALIMVLSILLHGEKSGYSNEDGIDVITEVLN